MHVTGECRHVLCGDTLEYVLEGHVTSALFQAQESTLMILCVPEVYAQIRTSAVDIVM
jgi:hypothetical protein